MLLVHFHIFSYWMLSCFDIAENWAREVGEACTKGMTVVYVLLSLNLPYWQPLVDVSFEHPTFFIAYLFKLFTFINLVLFDNFRIVLEHVMWPITRKVRLLRRELDGQLIIFPFKRVFRSFWKSSSVVLVWFLETEGMHIFLCRVAVGEVFLLLLCQLVYLETVQIFCL